MTTGHKKYFADKILVHRGISEDLCGWEFVCRAGEKAQAEPGKYTVIAKAFLQGMYNLDIQSLGPF